MRVFKNLYKIFPDFFTISLKLERNILIFFITYAKLIIKSYPDVSQ